MIARKNQGGKKIPVVLVPPPHHTHHFHFSCDYLEIQCNQFLFHSIELI